ncbi:flagellar hook capping FlgD N-terminal domain-containing protein [Clostridium tyrobutyricum]|uniref:flagellar hook capping FlgD N-terminal domain-containing protein n=1 Tax=Clostridium tyrobutyricum TaxID=1519 RepID=UPI00057FEB31|nr:flagellar hook capping FlgD N-terminal domain-containing protein [Clostridium tyrobutyricum]MBV4426937.1 flagellar biosynthesis protein FlgD [Clostridium tyrobutyricum]MBV4429746.1 flagellar biosynthesis protein FlgD [Clostridium tyrobutyricum]MBV4442093.1 flagellar biosynthesis protein FlgD [Clostridium tyrobutyricum]
MPIQVSNSNNYSVPASADSTSSNDQKSYSVDSTSTNTTDRGTRIVKQGQDIDENMFLKILSAELANQDPTNSDNQSGTEYVSQLAQFSSLQQMLNLNTTNKLNAANSLINKYVTFSDTDSNGNAVSGIVTGVIKDGDSTYLNVMVGQSTDDKGNVSNQYQKLDINDVQRVDDLGDAYNQTSNNMMLLTASSLIGKNVDIDQKDESGNNYSGIVQSVSRGNGTIAVKVQLEDGTSKEFNFDDVLNVKNS